MLHFTLPAVSSNATIHEAIESLLSAGPSSVSGLAVVYSGMPQVRLVRAKQLGVAAMQGLRTVGEISPRHLSPVVQLKEHEAAVLSAGFRLDDAMQSRLGTALREQQANFGVVGAIKVGRMNLISLHEFYAGAYLSAPQIRWCSNKHYYPPLSATGPTCRLDGLPLQP
jgi:hypothetical protein